VTSSTASLIPLILDREPSRLARRARARSRANASGSRAAREGKELIPDPDERGSSGRDQPPAAEKQRVMLACNVQVPMPSCVEPNSEASLPAWGRFEMSGEVFECIEALDCGDDASEYLSNVNDCLELQDDGSFEVAGDDVDFLECGTDCLVELEDDDSCDDVGAAVDAHEACVDACLSEARARAEG
jgi:hypothetical protein